MKKSVIIILAVVSTVIIVSAVGVALISGMLGAVFNPTETPQIKEASIATTFGGGYDLDAGAYQLEGTAQNLGQKDAKNVSVDITFFNADTQQELKTQTISFGDITAENSKNINISIEFPSDSVRVTFSTTDPVWE
jgi:flagellar basal body-associated protein FliL